MYPIFKEVRFRNLYYTICSTTRKILEVCFRTLVPGMIPGIGVVIPGMIPGIGVVIPEMITGISVVIPWMISGISVVIPGMISGINVVIPGMPYISFQTLF